MFGHDQDDNDGNDKPNDDNQHDNQAANDVIEPSATDNTSDSDWKHPGPPPDDSDDSDDASTDSAPPADTPAPAEEFSTSQSQAEDMPAPHASSGAANDDLIDLKREALTKLSPLVGKLDQTPDEKFRTLMMMIQASDDQSLIKEAYETAQEIDDEKERAQALLDIVNEINYFTQNPPKPQ